MKPRPLNLLAAAGAGLGAYALLEPYRFRLNSHLVELTHGVPALRILHLSDLHLSGRDRRKAAWLRGLPARLGTEPDLVLATGDLLQDDSGIEPAARLLGDLPARLGRFYVLGSHDYYQAKFQLYTKYWTGRRDQIKAPPADTPALESALQRRGWVPLTNRCEVLDTPGGRIRLAGVDDPYLGRHRTHHLRRAPHDALALGLMHSPDLVSEFTLAGFDLVVAGHTHAGQVRLPLVGAVVTNCSLPAGLAGGLHRVGCTWLHVSPGLGHGRFSPVRLGAPPEATLLRLVPAVSGP